MRKSFKATCKLKTAVPYAAVPEDVRALVDADVTTAGRIKSRWHKTLGNVVDLPCDFSTEDPQSFEQHMADVHGRKSTRGGGSGRASPASCPWSPRRCGKPRVCSRTASPGWTSGIALERAAVAGSSSSSAVVAPR